MPDEGRSNILITREEFTEIPTHRGLQYIYTPESLAFWNLSADKGLIMEHGQYRCNIGRNHMPGSKHCSLATRAHNIGKQRGLLVSTKHLADGRLAVFYEARD